MKKKVISIILTITMISSMFPNIAFATKTYTENSSVEVEAVDGALEGQCGDEVHWILDENGTLTLSGQGEVYTYETPMEIPWFEYRNDVKKVVVEEGITYIDNYAFVECINLEEVQLPSSLLNIGYCAFLSCKSLKKVNIPDKVTTIPESCFKDCTSLETIVLHNKITEINGWAFNECTNLGKINIPTSVSYIGTDAFKGCFNLTIVANPSAYARTYALDNDIKFHGLPGDTMDWNISEDGTFTLFGSGSMYYFDKYEYIPWNSVRQNIKKIVVEEDISNLLSIVFADCDSLEEVQLPESLVELSAGLFINCNSLKKINIPNNIYNIPADIFKDCTSLQEIVVPEGVKRIEDSAFSGCTNLEKVRIPNSVEYIAENAFDGCSNLTIVAKPSSYARTYALDNDINFHGLPGDTMDWNLSEDGVLTLFGSGSMYYFDEFEHIPWNDVRDNIKKIVVEDGISYIHSIVFVECHNLEEVQLPDSLIELGGGLFINCNSLVTVNIPSKIYAVPSDIFKGCTSLKEVVIPDGINRIGDNSFSGCINLEKVCIPNSVEYISNNTFEGCSNLTIEANCSSYAWKYAKDNKIDRTASSTSNHIWIGEESCETTKVCENCGKKNGVAPGHIEVIDEAVKATCTKTGLTEGKHCSVCEKVLVKQDVVPAVKHSYSSSYTVDKKATTAADGSKSKHCTRSGCTAKSSITPIPKISSIKLSDSKCTYDGYNKTPSVTVKDSKGNLLKKDVDYKVTYASNRWDVGRYKVTITFRGNYSGTHYMYYTIVPKATTNTKAELYGYDDVKVSWTKARGASGYFVYYKKSTSSSYTYYSRTTGTSIKISNLTDGVKYNFKVVPYYYSNDTRYSSLESSVVSTYTLKKLSTPIVTRSGSQVKVKWTNINGESGYQISRSTSKTGTNVVYTYATTTGTSKLVSATKGKTYYYKVRAYKKIGDTKVYGPWSTVKSFKR